MAGIFQPEVIPVFLQESYPSECEMASPFAREGAIPSLFSQNGDKPLALWDISPMIQSH